MDLLHVHVPGAFQETGQVAVVKADSLEIRKSEPETLEEIDARELRGELQRPGVFLAYKYRSLPIKLGVELAKNSFIAVPQAVITHADLITAVATDKAQTTEVIYWVKNNDLQFLVVSLPKGSRLQSDVFVNREAQQPMRREGSEDMLVRLPSGDAARVAFPVRFVFESPSANPGRKTRLVGQRRRQCAAGGRCRHHGDAAHLVPAAERMALHRTLTAVRSRRNRRDRSWRDDAKHCQRGCCPPSARSSTRLIRRSRSQMPAVAGDVRTLYGSQVQQQGHREVLHRLGPPAEIGVELPWPAHHVLLSGARVFAFAPGRRPRCWNGSHDRQTALPRHLRPRGDAPHRIVERRQRPRPPQPRCWPR
jgi:hypothetical protein